MEVAVGLGTHESHRCRDAEDVSLERKPGHRKGVGSRAADEMRDRHGLNREQCRPILKRLLAGATRVFVFALRLQLRDEYHSFHEPAHHRCRWRKLGPAEVRQ